MDIDIGQWLKDWAIVLSAAATVTLAVAAFWAIRKTTGQSRKLIEENRRIRSQDAELNFKRQTLNDIVNWVIDINKYCIPIGGVGEETYKEWGRGIVASISGSGKWAVRNAQVFGKEFQGKVDNLLTVSLGLCDKIREVSQSKESTDESVPKILSKHSLEVFKATDSVLNAALKIKSDNKL